MFFELIATFVAGLGAAGLALILNRMTGGRLPRWTMPAAAGLAMIGVAMWSEATWAARTVDGLPKGVAVAETVEQSAWWRPWTYIWPQTTRIMAIDRTSVKAREDHSEIRLADLYLMARWQPTVRVPQLFRCTDPARADVTEAALHDPETADWHALPADSDIITLACEE